MNIENNIVKNAENGGNNSYMNRLPFSFKKYSLINIAAVKLCRKTSHLIVSSDEINIS